MATEAASLLLRRASGGDPLQAHEPDAPRTVADRPRRSDRIFNGIATAAALTSLVVVVGTAVFLVLGARPALRATGVVRFLTSSTWSASAKHFGVFGLLVGTVIIGAIALIEAVPLALALALFINEYAPARLRSLLVGIVDLLAALPSLVFGMWGFFALQPRQVGVARWLSVHLAAIPFFRLSKPGVLLASSAFVCGLVVGVMVLPIITSVSRDVMAQVPREQCEGALALGGTRWGMIRDVVLPFGRSGIVGATLLGFGRALGETIAIALIIVISYKPNIHVLESGGGSIAALIATKFGEAGSLERAGLVAAGLALFMLTLTVNLAARRIVARSARRSGQR